ncbi:PucR family transcriptional regulator [Pedococcus dokdonensis]|nr:helix-turn-helix domain-containing protein [Pedococcus dokdonensis]
MSDEFVRRVDARIASQVPEVGADHMLMDELHDSTRAQWRSFATSLVGDHTFTLPPAASALARSLARRGMDLSLLLKVYRSAQQSVFQFFTEVTDAFDESAPPRDEVLKFMWSRAEQWLNDSVEALIETFYAERHQLIEGALLRRTQLVDDLLRGSTANLDAASAELSHALTHWQTGLVVWAAGTDLADGADSAERLLDFANLAARALRAPRPLTLMTGSRELWFWVASPSQPELQSLAELVDALGEARLRLAHGVPARGLAGFRSSHVEARAAQRVSIEAVRPPAILDYRDVELVCLAAGSADLVNRMVVRELGALCAADKNLVQVRETLLAHYRGGFNVERTAEQLFVHKNTVRYRLARAEDLLGHPIEVQAAKVELALRHVELFGPPPMH